MSVDQYHNHRGEDSFVEGVVGMPSSSPRDGAWEQVSTADELYAQCEADLCQLCADVQSEAELLNEKMLWSDVTAEGIYHIFDGFRYDPNSSIWQKLYNHSDKVSAGMTRYEFDEYLKSLSTHELLHVIKTGAHCIDVIPHDIYDKVVDVIESQNFRLVYDRLQEFGVHDDDTIYAECFSMLFERQSDYYMQRDIKVFLSDDFDTYYQTLQSRYGVTTVVPLALTVSKYSYYTSITKVLSEEYQSAFDMIVDEFPEMELGSFRFVGMREKYDLRSVDDLSAALESGEFATLVDDKRRLYNILTTQYGFSISSPSERVALFHMDERAYSQLADPRIQEYISYIQETYAPILSDVVSLDRSLFSLRRLPLHIFPQQYDEFLHIFGYDLSQFGRVDGSSRDGLGKMIDSEEERSGFVQYIDDLKRSNDAIDSWLSSGDIFISDIEKLFVAYRDGQYEALVFANKLCAILGWTAYILDSKDIDQKVAILATVNRLGWDFTYRTTLGKLEWGVDDFQVLSHLYTAEDARDLYTLLYEERNVSSISFVDFNFLLENEQERVLLADSVVRDKVMALDEIYKFSEKYGVTGGKIAGDLLLYVDRLIEVYEIAVGEGFYSRIIEYNIQGFESGNFGVWDLLILVENDVLRSDKFYDVALKINDQPFNLDNASIGDLLTSLDGKEDLFLLDSLINTVEFRNLFLFLQRLYGGNNPSSVSINRVAFLYAFYLAETNDNTDKIIDVANVFIDLGFALNSWDNIDYIAHHILQDDDIVNALLNDEFMIFYQRLSSLLYDDSILPVHVGEIVELFLTTDEEEREMIFSERLHEVVSYVGKRFYITDLAPSTLAPFIKISLQFDSERYDKIISLLESDGYEVNANDLMLINAIVSNDDLWDLAQSREEMIQIIGEEMYEQTTPHFRTSDQIVSLEQRVKSLQDSGRSNIDSEIAGLQRQIDELRATYTERPALEILSTMQLMRIYLLHNALSDQQFLMDLSHLIVADVHDQTTEYGGLLKIEQDGGLILSNVQSSNRIDDGAYSNTKYQFFLDGAMSFHMHALTTDESKYSGPSGWYGAGGGDITYVDWRGGVDVVFTPLGFDDETGLLRVNVDAYYIDKRGDPHAVIVDMGVVEVTYPDTNTAE